MTRPPDADVERLQILVTDPIISRFADTLTSGHADGHEWSIAADWPVERVRAAIADTDVIVCSRLPAELAARTTPDRPSPEGRRPFLHNGPMVERYPSVEPYESGMLDVGDGHRLYWETVGNPLGTPAVFLHGGPGSGCTTGARSNFDPQAYRAVLFDQRGAGRSTPNAGDTGAALSANTTAHLLDDIERLRDHLGIDRWVVVVGVSWGVTLGLAYAQRHPDRVRAMVLAAVTSGTRRETDWLTRDIGRVFPREWERFVSCVPEPERDDLCTAYATMLASEDPAVRDRAALHWCAWEDTHVSLMPGWEPDTRYDDPQFRLAFARLVTHYWSNDCFLDEEQIRRDIALLEGIPAVLLHGRFDVSSPLETAWELHRRWPSSELVVLDEAGHGGGDFVEQLVGSIDSFQDAP